MDIINDVEYESNRLKELKKYNILDSFTEKDYEDITFMASIICDTPVALITFIDEDRQWFKSHKGVEQTGTPREIAFCSHAILTPDKPLIVPDLREDLKFKNNPLVTGAPNVVFYAGVPLVTENGYGLGTVCVLDTRPHQLTQTQLEALKVLAAQVMNLLEVRKKTMLLEEIKLQLEASNNDLQKTARQIEKEQAKLNIIIEGSDLGTWEIDMKTREVSFSERFVQISGLKEKEHVTLDDTKKLIHPDDLEIRNEAFTAAMRTGKLYYAGRILWPDRSVRWVESRGRVFYDDNASPTKIIGTIRDVTKERVHQEILEKSEEKFRLLADSMPQHIWTADIEGNLNYYNQSVYDYSGLSPEQLNSKGWLQIMHPDDRQENENQWTKAVSNGTPFLFEHRFQRYDNSYRWQLSRAIPQKDSLGNIQMWVGTSTDIQEQKLFANELENKVAERTAELEKKNLDLLRMNKELESFAYISSHDLQEPLRKIQSFTSVIMASEFDRLSEKGKDFFNRIRNAAGRMQSLINDLLTYSRTSTEERIFKKTDLNKIIAEVKDDLKEEIESKQAVITTSGLCELNIIPFQVRQLFQNLFTNSLKFAKAGVPSQIDITADKMNAAEIDSVEVARNAEYCHLKITDNGIGFQDIYNQKIFELFQRLHGRSEYTGTGIGLAIVKKIVDNHHGIISATSQPGEGATFNIYFPV